MRRYGDTETYSYCLGAFSDYEVAENKGLEVYEHRGHDYEPEIVECIMNGVVVEKYHPVANKTKD